MREILLVHTGHSKIRLILYFFKRIPSLEFDKRICQLSYLVAI